MHNPKDMDDENLYALERRLEGTFKKIMNNTRFIHCTEGDEAQKMFAFAHFTLERYKGKYNGN